MKPVLILGLFMVSIFSTLIAYQYKQSLANMHELNQQQLFAIEDRDSQIAELKLNLKYERLFAELGK